MTEQALTTMQNQLTAAHATPPQLPSLSAYQMSTEQINALVEAQGKIMIARQFPRDLPSVRQEAIYVCQSPEFAERAEWSWPVKSRDGREEIISGVSIRLVEAAAAALGHLDYGYRTLSESIEQRNGQACGVAKCQAYAWDMQKNNRVVRDFSVAYWRDTRNGGYPLTSERDKLMLVASKAQRFVRQCLTAIIPPYLISEMRAACQATIKSQGSLDQRKAAMVNKFAEVDVTIAMIESRMDKKIKDLTGPEVSKLGRMYTAIIDEIATVKDLFAPKESAEDESAPASFSQQRQEAKKKEMDSRFEDVESVQPVTETEEPKQTKAKKSTKASKLDAEVRPKRLGDTELGRNTCLKYSEMRIEFECLNAPNMPKERAGELKIEYYDEACSWTDPKQVVDLCEKYSLALKEKREEQP